MIFNMVHIDNFKDNRIFVDSRILKFCNKSTKAALKLIFCHLLIQTPTKANM